MQFRRNYIFELCQKPYVSCQQLHIFSFKLDLIVSVLVIVTYNNDDGCEWVYVNRLVDNGTYLGNVIGLRYRRGNGFLDFVHYYIVLATR